MCSATKSAIDRGRAAIATARALLSARLHPSMEASRKNKMNVCAELKRDHTGLVRLLARAARTSARSRSARSELLDRAHTAFEACAKAEEGHLLPALRAHGSGDEALHQRRLADSVQGLADVRRMFDELRDTDPGDPCWIARLIPLTEHVERRIEQHQREFFPLAKRGLASIRPAHEARSVPTARKKSDGTESLWV
jgi:hypothetical protein